MAEQLIFVVEDEEAYVDALSVGLAREGFRVEVARDGAEAIERFAQVDPDLVLLDLMLPRVSGVDVCREIRTRSQVPIIMVTARTSELDTVVGLEAGADDYVTKPYRFRELIARIRAMLRRGVNHSGDADEDADQARIEVGDVSIDVSSHEVVVRGEQVTLPLKEFELLYALMAQAGMVQPRGVLIDRVWGHDYVGDTKTLDVHVQRLRAKLEPESSNPTRIITIRGIGYKFDRPR